ncbi:hypothetical protein BC828DRAFT_389095 [Blastocladiella britannica]|nr:hypothetical protein BC828DRAFT_389095 [Blastocladiella britannica]
MASTSTIALLPDDTLIHICAHLTQTESVVFLRACKALAPVAHDVLYRHATVRNPQALSKFANTVWNSAECAATVHRVRLPRDFMDPVQAAAAVVAISAASSTSGQSPSSSPVRGGGGKNGSSGSLSGVEDGDNGPEDDDQTGLDHHDDSGQTVHRGLDGNGTWRLVCLLTAIAKSCPNLRLLDLSATNGTLNAHFAPDLGRSGSNVEALVREMQRRQLAIDMGPLGCLGFLPRRPAWLPRAGARLRVTAADWRHGTVGIADTHGPRALGATAFRPLSVSRTSTLARVRDIFICSDTFMNADPSSLRLDAASGPDPTTDLLADALLDVPSLSFIDPTLMGRLLDPVPPQGCQRARVHVRLAPALGSSLAVVGLLPDYSTTKSPTSPLQPHFPPAAWTAITTLTLVNAMYVTDVNVADMVHTLATGMPRLAALAMTSVSACAFPMLSVMDALIYRPGAPLRDLSIVGFASRGHAANAAAAAAAAAEVASHSIWADPERAISPHVPSTGDRYRPRLAPALDRLVLSRAFETDVRSSVAPTAISLHAALAARLQILSLAGITVAIHGADADSAGAPTFLAWTLPQTAATVTAANDDAVPLLGDAATPLTAMAATPFPRLRALKIEDARRGSTAAPLLPGLLPGSAPRLECLIAERVSGATASAATVVGMVSGFPRLTHVALESFFMPIAQVNRLDRSLFGVRTQQQQGRRSAAAGPKQHPRDGQNMPTSAPPRLVRAIVHNVGDIGGWLVGGSGADPMAAAPSSSSSSSRPDGRPSSPPPPVPPGTTEESVGRGSNAPLRDPLAEIAEEERRVAADAARRGGGIRVISEADGRTIKQWMARQWRLSALA